MSEQQDTPQEASGRDLSNTGASNRGSKKDIIVAASCGVLVAVMVGASFAAVPFYSWFCRETGFGGTTQVAAAAPDHIGTRSITVRFDANVGGGLPWKFEPEQTKVSLKLGETKTIFYKVTNLSARKTVAQASYNVSPPLMGGYFVKINCFCFTEQSFDPGESRDMPVVFYVDPKLAGDPDLKHVDTVTLSYTFYPVRDPVAPVAEREKTQPRG